MLLFVPKAAVPNITAGPLMGGAANNISGGFGLNKQSILIWLRALEHFIIMANRGSIVPKRPPI